MILAVDGPVATITIDRERAMNAMSSVEHAALSDHLDELAHDHTIRVIVLTGAGTRAFSAGRDLKEVAAAPAMAPDARQIVDDRWARLTRLTDRFDYPKVTIARINGVALGGGFELALACDLIIAADNASFGLPEPRRGLIPLAGGVHRLPRQIPLKAAMGLLLTGSPIDAARAYELGLVNEVVPLHRLDDAIARWTADIIACAPLSLQAIKQIVAQGLGSPLESAIAAPYDAEARRAQSADAREGPRAFAEKRSPVWQGK